MSRSRSVMSMPQIRRLVLPNWATVFALGWAALVLSIFVYLCWQIAVLPTRFVPQQISLRMAAGQQQVLGREELAAVLAGRGQLRLRRDLAGRWWGGLGLGEHGENAGKNLIWQDAGQTWRARSLRLEAGMVLPLSPALKVVAIEPVLILQAADGKTWRFDGQRLLGEAVEPCPQFSKYLKFEQISHASHLTSHLTSHLPSYLASAWLGRAGQALHLGGNLNCGLRLAWPELRPQAMNISKLADAGYELNLHSTQLPKEFLAWLTKREFELRDGGKLLIGRSAYRVELSAGPHKDRLKFLPQARLDWFAQAAPPLLGTQLAAQNSPSIAWQWRVWSIWDLPSAWPSWLAQSAIGICASVLLYLFLAKFRQSSTLLSVLSVLSAPNKPQMRQPRRTLSAHYLIACGLSLVLALLATIAWAYGIALGPAWIICILALSLAQAAWFAWYAWSQLQGLGLVLGLLVLLILTGLLNQLSLGVLAQETAGLRHFQTNASVLSIALALFFPAWLWLNQGAQQHSLALPNICLWLAGLALFGLILEFLIGDETGLLGWLQPVELAKTGLILLGALCLALFATQSRQTKLNQTLATSLARPNLLIFKRWMQGALDRWHQAWQRGRAYLLPLVLFACLMLLVLVAVRDFSPLILLAIWAWGVALALAWFGLTRLNSNVWGAGGLLILLLGLASLLLSLGLGVYHDAILSDLSSLPFWSERLQVWRAPELFPHSGGQFLSAFSLAQQGSGAATPPFDLALAWQIPQIQNDFAPAFFIARFSLGAAQLLLGLQIAYLLALWRVANATLRRANLAEGGNFRLRQLAMLRYFAIVGLLAMMAAHFAISWSSNLGFLPVMGQPMPFVSAAGSMLLLFVMPLHLLLPPAPAPAPAPAQT